MLVTFLFSLIYKDIHSLMCFPPPFLASFGHARAAVEAAKRGLPRLFCRVAAMAVAFILRLCAAGA
jgi:hypothetical protein